MSTPSSTIPCDLAITNGQVLTLGEACKVYEPGLVLIHNHRIVYVGFDGKRAPDYQAKEKLDAGGSIVMPTFLNGHNHAGMSLYRGLGNDLDLDEWLNRVVWPLETKHCTAPNVYLGTMLSAIEMIRSGVSFFADMYFFQDEVATVCEELGMRVILGEGVLDFPTPNSKTPEECLKYTERLTQKYHQHPLIGISVPAHAPYSCTPEVLREVAELASRLNIPATIHLAETQKEFSTYQQQYGKTPTQYIADLGFLEGRAVAARQREVIEAPTTALKLERLLELGVETLICGAISEPLHKELTARGVEVIGFVAGEIEEVVTTYLAGGLPSPELSMPGCRHGDATNATES